MFELYKEEKSVFTFDDYGTLIAEAKRANAKTVLEFGPGNSTLAWVEAGCTDITTLEHQAKWFMIAKANLAKYKNVKLLPYNNTPVIEIPALNGKKFDLIFVDSPVGMEASPKFAPRFPGQENCSRLNTLLFALDRAPVILLHDAKREGEQNTLKRLNGAYNIEMIDTVKGFARITRNAA